ncbi:hypothetical protein Zmor_004416 [Zophobas morio]|jgi:hypothetical protein|uniref:Uncharacterized protein n=1 Tax=Zophobas morio TaxID=2755281 RepID=A0AA38HIW8_9CUCU|nr:hypothetical protein Zmor_004416 [Zophobas morio]
MLLKQFTVTKCCDKRKLGLAWHAIISSIDPSLMNIVRQVRVLDKLGYLMKSFQLRNALYIRFNLVTEGIFLVFKEEFANIKKLKGGRRQITNEPRHCLKLQDGICRQGFREPYQITVYGPPLSRR